jgi:benzodiazapine receptor
MIAHDDRLRRSLGLVAWIALPFLAAWFGVQFPAGDYYALLERPSWSPPAWIFGPAWTILYVSMGVAAGLVWLRHGFAGARFALSLFLLQLLLNAAWSWIFFGLRAPGWALVEILCLWVAITATVGAFWRKRRAAGALLSPYLAWVTFAAALNAEIWRLNT